MDASWFLSPVLRKRCLQSIDTEEVENIAQKMLLVGWPQPIIDLLEERNKHLVTISLMSNSEISVSSGMMFRVIKSTTE